MDIFEEEDDVFVPDDDIDEVDDGDESENEFVDRQLTVLTEDKDDGFEEEDLMNDELRDDDISHYEETIEEVTEFAAGRSIYKTGKFLNKYEYPRIVSTRATQIQYGATPLIKLVDPLTGRTLKSPLEIAEEELRQGKLPLVIERPLPTKIPHKYIYETRPLNTLIK